MERFVMCGKLWMMCVVATALCLTACSAQRPGLLVIEPSYSHMRDGMVNASAASVGVTAGAEETFFAEDRD